MRNSLVLLWWMYLSVLELATGCKLPKRSESSSWSPWASFYRHKEVATVAHRRWKGVQWMSLSSGTVGQTHLMRCRRALLALSGMARKLVPAVAALPRFDTRPGQRGMQHHVGWQATELAWW